MYSTSPSFFVDVPLRLLDSALTSLEGLAELDVFDMARADDSRRTPSRDPRSHTPHSPYAGARRRLCDGHPPLCPLGRSRGAPPHGVAAHALTASLVPLEAYIDGLRPHEELLRREEVAWCKEFAARPEESPRSR